MDYKLDILPEAINDIDEIVTWYGDIDDKLSLRFLDSLSEVFDSIQANPLGFVKIKRNYRKVNLQVFPYKVVFKVSKRRVIVTTVIHHKRHPKLLTKRK